MTSATSSSNQPTILNSTQVCVFGQKLRLHSFVLSEDPENENYQTLAARLWPQYLVCLSHFFLPSSPFTRCKIERKKMLSHFTLRTWWLAIGREAITGWYTIIQYLTSSPNFETFLSTISHTWSKMLAADIFSAYTEAGLDNPQVFEKSILLAWHCRNLSSGSAKSVVEVEENLLECWQCNSSCSAFQRIQR